ncbi:Predicted gene 5134 [Apodemus speciosus]|uniref:Predicted gene 5134 n=1 Tax=Apodemus speciosus TaxID=105296 RepID=A0ABQ0F801_APOSI
MPREPEVELGTEPLFRVLAAVLPGLGAAAMDPAENYRGFTWNQSALGLSIHSTTDTLVMTFYLLLVVCVGLWCLSVTQSRDNQRLLPGWPESSMVVEMGISIYSSNTGSGHYMALAGIGAASGIAVGALEWNTIFMLFVLGWIFVPIYSRLRVVTLPEYLKKRFGSLRIQLFFTIVFLIVYIFSRISMEIGFGAMFLKMVWDTDIYQTMLTVLTIIGLYTITGGLATVAYVETFQAGIMVLGSALLMGYDTVSVQRFLAGKSRLHMEGGCLLCGYLKLLPMFLMVMPGMISRILFPDKVACAVPSECRKFCGRGTGCSALAYPVLVLGVAPPVPAPCCAEPVHLDSTAATKSSWRIREASPETRRECQETADWSAAAVSCTLSSWNEGFFVIILLAVTIVWIPIIEMAPNEILFEYMQVLKSCLTPSVTAVFLLAVFCKRVNEQGAFWGLILGTAIGVFRLLAEFYYGPVTCGVDRHCPAFICGLHYLYFGFCLFVITILIILAISFATEPIPDHYLHGMFGEAHTCLWKFWDLFCGLDTQPKSKTGPENTTEQELEETWKQVVATDRSTALGILARRMAARKSEEHMDRMKDWSEELDSPFWKRVVQASAVLLFLLLITAHIYFA